MREEGFADQEVDDFYQAKDLLGQWVKYYNEERLHSALNYLRPVDYYKGNPETLLAERKRKLKEAAASRREINKLVNPAKTKVGSAPRQSLIHPGGEIPSLLRLSQPAGIESCVVARSVDRATDRP